ncbi:hypothetical protein BVG94_02490 [Serratia marcescens]|uniref:hypothetical protein n=1 Tax=Serratia marcescens TaxID=615 RepID=UPI000B6175A3|nr:hypothetical protein [Serratia marcescens]ASL91584.1 hypothetical protein BVG94_02490 [Serratia marcescens]
MTLTTEREEFEKWFELTCGLPWGFLAKRREPSGRYMEIPHEDAWQVWQASRALLANWEAQPVALVDRRPAASGSICWQNGGKDLAHGTELFTAPPTPAMPEEMTGGIAMSKYKVKKSNYVQWVKGWNACRSAMLAQPVSSSYTLPEGGNDHNTRR